MTETNRLYNSRIVKVYLAYLERNYPHVERGALLKESDISLYEVEDHGHWFIQEQMDRFQKAMVQVTGNTHIARDAGRFAVSTEGLGMIKQYALGFMNLSSVYLMMGKISRMMNRGIQALVNKLGGTQVEIIVQVQEGVKEKPYQCQNRLGMYESVAKLFTKEFAHIEHPECFHRGDKHCRYLVTWESTPFARWRLVRNYALVASGLFTLFFLLFDAVAYWPAILTASAFAILILFFVCERLENKDLKKTLKMQGDTARQNMEETENRYNNALLVQEIGQATSSILNPRELIVTMSQIMEKRLDFDRGGIWLADKERTRLIFQAGYGYDQEQETLLRNTHFHLDNPRSQGPFVACFREQKPVLINDVLENWGRLSETSLLLAKRLNVHSLVCVPIVYEKEALGVLTVDNMHTKRPLTKTDMSLLIGVASQAAVSLVNARSFQKMQDSERKYRELVENANSIILRIDPKGSLAFINEFAQRFFGYEEHEILGRHVVPTLLMDTEEVRREVRNLLRNIVNQPDRRWTTESRNKRKSGDNVWIAWTFRTIVNEEGDVREILCIGNDITELKAEERKRHDLELRLQRAQKMEAIGTLAGGVAHDLNNILAGLVSYPELLLMKLPEDSELRKPIATIQKAGEKAASIVQDLLTLARRGVTTAEALSLNRVITEYLESPEFEALSIHHPGVEVEMDLDVDLFNIMGSPVHISKTVMNLISNAAEAMPNGGKITISTRNVPLEKPHRGFTRVDAGDYAVLTVSDTGVGIEQKDLERIFEPFYTKKKMGRSGTGLGMAVVWGTVQDHKGSIDVKSQVGKGTTFTLYFPVTREAAPGEAGDGKRDRDKGKGETILVVDDVAEQREVAQGILEELGYRVTCVSSGEEAVSYLKEHSADLLLLDMIMAPGMDGLETYRKVLELRPGEKAVIASGYSESDRVREAQRLGAGPYVKKPYRIEEIAAIIRQELDR